MKTLQIATLALVVAGGGLLAADVRADEPQSHAATHDHAAMQKSEAKIAEALQSLSTEDQKLATAQRFCPVMTYDRLGSMGTPIKMMVNGKPVFLCCESCQEKAAENSARTLKTAEKLKESTTELAELPMEERQQVEAQKYCAVIDTSLLGSMGAPIKMEIEGKSVYLCCAGCTKKAKADPAGTLAKAEELVSDGHPHGDDHDHK